MPEDRSSARKIPASLPLYLQITFVTLAFALMAVSSGIFVNNMLVNYLKRDAVNILLQTQIRIMDDLLESETLMIPIVKDVHDIIIHGGDAEDVHEYFNGISSDLHNKEGGFVFDGLHGYFEAFGNVYIPAPGWTVPDDYNATERPWFKAAVEADGKITITPMYLSLRSGEYQINVACRIFDDAGVSLGVISMNVLLRNIAQFVADMHLVEGGYGFLANEDFVLVAHHEEEFVTRNMGEISSGFRQIIEIMEQGANFAKVDGYNYEGKRSIFYCERIENGWYLGIMTPRNVYYKDLRILITFLGALGFVLMLTVNIILIQIDSRKRKLDEAFREQSVHLALMEEARVLDERVQLMFDTAPFGATLFDKNYNVVDCNQAILLTLGLAGKKNEYLAKFFEFSPEYQPNGERTENLLREYVDAAFKNHGGPYLWTHKRINGELIPCEITLIQSIYMDQEVVIGYARDLSTEAYIDDLKIMTDSLNKRLEQQSLMTYISQNFLSDKDMDVLITEALCKIGEFMGIDQILMHTTEDNGISFSCKYEWINPKLELPTRVGGTFSIGKPVLDIIHKVKENGLFYVTSNDPEVKEAVAPYRVSFQNYILTCVFLGDVLYAVIDFAREGEDELWDQNKISMASYVTNVLVGALNKRTAELMLITAADTLDKRLEQQSLMTYISQSFLSTGDMNTLITEALRMVGEFMGIDQILMLETEDNGNSYTCTNAWLNPKYEFKNRVGITFSVNKPIVNILRKAKEKEYFYVTSNDPEAREAVAPYRIDFYNYLMAFILLGDKLQAIIDFSVMEEDIQWDQEKINMAAYMANILTNALNKRNAEFQLIAAKETAEQSNRSKGIFLAQMSHEIRTPMNAILGVSEIQLHDKTLSPVAVEAFRQIYDSGNLLLNIINDILDFSKVEAGKLEIVSAKYDVPSLLNDTVQLNRLRYESKPLEFKLNLDADTPLELYGDELRIKQILNNLLSNAFKYTDKGKIDLSVHAEKQDEETVTLVIRVSDTGQGMREDQIDRLFDEYSRFNMQTNRGISGTGLGMSISKRLIEMMGGGIFVESVVDEGSIFTVRLPQKCATQAVCGPEIAESLRNFSFRNMPISKKAQIVHEYMPYGSVLVVDDIASNLYVAKGLLAPYGLRIETAASGIEAIEKIKTGSEYDIVFMDHMMPAIDGMETTKTIRGMGYTSPVVALTANAVVGQSDVFLANGFDGFISKPIDSRELDAILNRFIRDKQPSDVIEAARRKQSERESEISSGPVQTSRQVSEIEKYFVLDAENAIKIIEGLFDKLPDDKAVDSYIIAVHGMKNVLANIGETELSAVALRLEKAGYEQDLTVITQETNAFLDALRFLAGKFKAADSANDDTTEITDDDTVYLRNKLLAVKTACDEFDITAAREALDHLLKKTWPRSVNNVLDEISVHLLHSAFRKASAAAENIIRGLNSL